MWSDGDRIISLGDNTVGCGNGTIFSIFILNGKWRVSTLWIGTIMFWLTPTESWKDTAAVLKGSSGL